MIYRFVIVSNEVPDFRRDLRIEGTSTFLAFRDALHAAVGYADDLVGIFEITDRQWRPQQQVFPYELTRRRADEETYLMSNTPLDELLQEEKQLLTYLFDIEEGRRLFIELREITYGERIAAPEVVRSKGEAPLPVLEPIAPPTAPAPPKTQTAQLVEEPDEDLGNDYGSDDFSLDEIDEEGFGIEEEDTL